MIAEFVLDAPLAERSSGLYKEMPRSATLRPQKRRLAALRRPGRKFYGAAKICRHFRPDFALQTIDRAVDSKRIRPPLGDRS
jgi:hypothetical protein